MTIALWPADLPQTVRVDGFGLAQADGRLRLPMDTGPEQVRRRTSAAVKPFASQMRVDTNQMARLDRFWIEEIGCGALPFMFPDPVNDGQPLLDDTGVALTDENDVPLLVTAWYLLMFAEKYTISALRSGRYMVAMQLSVMP